MTGIASSAAPQPATQPRTQPLLVTLPAEIGLANARTAVNNWPHRAPSGDKVVIADMTATTFCDSAGAYAEVFSRAYSRVLTEVAILGFSASAQAQVDGRADAERLFESICALYDLVFSRPPFRWTEEESQHHRKMLSSLMEDPTFGIATAQADGKLVGFAYGYQLPPGTKWWQNFLDPIPDDLARESPGRTFALIDLAVDQAWRGHGLGRKLTEMLLDSRDEQRATLSVQPTATDTQAFYVHLGWRLVGRKKMPPGVVSPFFDIYVVDLRPQP